MGDERKAPQGFSLRRWSQRKLAAARDERTNANAPAPDAPPRDVAGFPEQPAPVADAATHGALQPGAGDATPSPSAHSGEVTPALPPVESLTFDSDFTAFMQKGVDENVRRSALRKLLRDPRFNVMDGLDVYIDDYSKPSPIEPELVRTLMQARYLFNPPKTRVTADGVVEDVPESEGAGEPGALDEAKALPAPEPLLAAGPHVSAERMSTSVAREIAGEREDAPPAAPAQRRDTES